jgi:hypothetical protein
MPLQIALIIALSLHILSSVFWAGTSFALARTGGVGGEQLFRPQMAAATIAVLTGGYLGHLVHAGTFGTAEQVLAIGALAALVAQGSKAQSAAARSGSLRVGKTDEAEARSRLATAQRIAAVLLAVTARLHGGGALCLTVVSLAKRGRVLPRMLLDWTNWRRPDPRISS